MTKPPCYNCDPENKYEACHDKCPDFLAWKANRNKIMAKMSNETHTHSIWPTELDQQIRRVKQHNGRKWGK